MIGEQNLTIRRVLEKAMELRDRSEVVQMVAKLGRQLTDEATQEWNAASEASVLGDQPTAEHHRGKAHELCRVLGDQSGLWWAFEWVEGGDEDVSPS